MMCSTPNSSARPAATNASDAPTKSPLSSWMRIWSTTLSPRFAEHGRRQLVWAREVAWLVGADKHAAIHGVQAAAQLPQQIERRIDYQDCHAGLSRGQERIGNQLDVGGHQPFGR